MEQLYMTALANGHKFRVQNIDLSATRTLLDNQKTFAIQVADKAIQKGLISYILGVDELVTDNHNFVLALANETFFFEVENPSATIAAIVSDINNKQWVEVAGKIVFNRNIFQYAEEIQETQSND